MCVCVCPSCVCVFQNSSQANKSVRKLKKRDRSSLRTVLLFVATMNRMNDEINEGRERECKRRKKMPKQRRQNKNNNNTFTENVSLLPLLSNRSQKMRLGSAEKILLCLLLFPTRSRGVIAAAPMMKKVGVKLGGDRDLSHWAGGLF